MPKWIDCPFYMYDKGDYIKCEGGRKTFDSHEELLKYLNEVCGSVSTYKTCDLACASEKEWEENELAKKESKISEMKRDRDRYKYLAEAKDREVKALREAIDVHKAKVDASMLFITVALKKLGVISVEITKAELTDAMKTKVHVENHEGRWVLIVEQKPEKEKKA